MNLSHEPNVCFQKIVEAKLISSHHVMLMWLLNKSGCGHTVADVVDATGLSFQTVSMAKKKLLKCKLIEERHPFRDLRSTKVYLTPAGRVESHALWDLLIALGKCHSAHYRAACAD
jgi:DNA-binding MarR family transcriptional regulator